MDRLALPSLEYVASRLSVDLEKGLLFWKAKDEKEEPRPRERNRWNSRWAGKPAGTVEEENGCKRVRVRLRDNAYPAHSLIWLLHTGCAPKEELDHINGNGADNRLSNLRDVSHSVNMRNKKRYKNNSSGVAGVVFYAPTNRWKATVQADGQKIDLGYFKHKQDAATAVLQTRKQHAFTDTHGVRA
jgi:hypothetical protein